jgi:transposase
MRMSTSLTIVYDLGRGRIVWIGRDRDTTTMERFFAWLGRRRARAIHTVCCDMWSIDIDAVQKHLPRAAIVFDRFHLSQHLSRAPDSNLRPSWTPRVRQRRKTSGATATDGNALRTSRSVVTRGAPTSSASATNSQSYAAHPERAARWRT